MSSRGRWEALGALPPDRLEALRKVATIESVGSPTRIDGANLSDAEVEDLLSRVLTTLLLLRAGYTYVPYASLERVIEENKDLYDKALRRRQTTSWPPMRACSATARRAPHGIQRERGVARGRRRCGSTPSWFTVTRNSMTMRPAIRRRGHRRLS